MKVRSKHGLTRCDDCGRHIQAGATVAETTCPFCARSQSGRSRGMALAGALVLAACGGGAEEPDPHGQTQGGEVEPSPSDTPSHAAGDDPGASPTDPAQADPGYGPEPEDPPVVAEYGVPPMDADEPGW